MALDGKAIAAALLAHLGLALFACGGAQSSGGAGDPQILVDGSSILIVEDLDDPTPVKIHFELDSHVLRETSHHPLAVLADFVNSRDDYALIEVHGHSDERGSEQYNRELSTRRAQSVVDYLVGEGVERERLRPRGFGSSRPAVQGSGESAWSQNRRVEFVLVDVENS